MTANAYSDMVFAALLAIVLIFVAKYFAAIFQAWAQRSNDRQYRILAEKVTAVQTETQAAMAGIQADLSRIATTLAAVEKILQQVE
jgi:hypothetical protein